jgi:hypothetical protein
MAATPPDPAQSDVDDFQHAAEMKAKYRTLRFAIVLIKIVAVLYLVVGTTSAIYEYSKASSAYDDAMVRYSTSTPETAIYMTMPDKPSSAGVLVAIFRDALVAFFVWVSGEVIKMQLAIADDASMVRARSDARRFGGKGAGGGGWP